MPSTELKNRLKGLQEDLSSDRRYIEQLKESGLVSVIIVPILEDHLGFDPLRDLHFEFKPPHSATVHFDILAQTSPTCNCIFEIKEVDALADQALKRKARQQVGKYLEAEDDFYFGLLTDFVDWEVFISRYYIERVGNEGKRIETIKDKVPCCFEFKVDDGLFWDYLSVFARDTFGQNLTQLTKGVAKIALKKPGKMAWGKLFPMIDIQKQKECGDNVRQYVIDNFSVEHGEYWKAILAGTVHAGSRILFDDGIISFEMTVLSDGCLEVDPKTVMQKEPYFKVIGKFRGFGNVMSDWKDPESCTHTDRARILKSLLDKSWIQMGKYENAWRNL